MGINLSLYFFISQVIYSQLDMFLMPEIRSYTFKIFAYILSENGMNFLLILHIIIDLSLVSRIIFD